MFKRCKVVMLPTDQESNLWITWKQVLAYNHSLCKLVGGQHLYILSDDKIEEGDWCYSVNFKGTYIARITEGCYVSKERFNTFASKIIATTDKSILLNGYDSSDEDAIVKYYLPQPSQAFIKKYITEYNKGNVISDVLVEYEDNGYKVDMEGIGGEAVGWMPKIELKVSKDNTITIKKVKNSWTREEVHNLMMQAWIYGQSKPECHYSVREKWIESNL